MTVEVELYARNMELSENTKEYVTKKASKLDRYLSDVEHVRVDLTYIKSARSAEDRNVAQITVHGQRSSSACRRTRSRYHRRDRYCD